jgi:hypothetical protein
MNHLLVFLGIAGILVGGFFILGQYGLLPDGFWELSLDQGLVQMVVGVGIAGFGFIRFNKLIGWVSIVLGILILLPGLHFISFSIIPVWLAPWLLVALGGRSLVIGFFSDDNEA